MSKEPSALHVQVGAAYTGLLPNLADRVSMFHDLERHFP